MATGKMKRRYSSAISSPSSGWERRSGSSASQDRQEPPALPRREAELRHTASPSRAWGREPCGASRLSGYNQQMAPRPRPRPTMRVITRALLALPLLFAACPAALADETADKVASQKKAAQENWEAVGGEAAHVETAHLLVYAPKAF